MPLTPGSSERFATGEATTRGEEPRSWGPLATLGWAIVIILAADFASVWAYWQSAQGTIFGPPSTQLGPTTWSIVAGSAATTLLLIIALQLRRRATLVYSLALNRVRWSTAWPWTLLAIVTAIPVAWIRWGQEAQFGSNILAQETLAVFLIAFVVWSPLHEEALFRGFMLTGLSRTRLGYAAAVPISAAMWAGVHLDATWTGFAALFVLGCVLGVARRTCNSILPGLFIHAANNGVVVCTEILRSTS